MQKMKGTNENIINETNKDGKTKTNMKNGKIKKS